MSDPLKSLPKTLPRIPSLQEIATSIVNNHAECREGVEMTDALLDELNLKITFLMRTIHITAPVNGGIVGLDGKAEAVRKNAEQVYHEVGRAALLKEREDRRAASLQAAEAAAASHSVAPATINGENHDAADQALADAEASPTKH